MKKVILVDMENMQKEGYMQIPHLKVKEHKLEIVFFESDFTTEIPVHIQRQLADKGVDYSFEWVDRNAINKDTMDFQIVAYLALRSRLAQAEAEEYFILSKDSDFNLPCRYIAEQAGVDVSIIKTLSAFVDKSQMADKRITINYIINCCVDEAKSKQQLHCLLQKTLKQYYCQWDITDIYYECLPRFHGKSA